MSVAVLPEWLQADIVPLAWLWRIARGDGLVLGFTSHDRDLVRDGLLYAAAPGIQPSALALSDSLEADTMDLGGALTSDAITAEDLKAGRWDGAAVRLMVANWEDAGVPTITVAEGTLGAVEQRHGGFTAELRSVGGADAAALLARPVAPETSPSCRARLGDGDCRVDLAPLTRLAEIAAADGSHVGIAGLLNGADYGFGRLRFLDGANCGLSRMIVSGAGPDLVLGEAPAFAVEAGVRVELIEGCDRNIATCSARFANAVNFRGEPYLPGMDYVTRYPGA